MVGGIQYVLKMPFSMLSQAKLYTFELNILIISLSGYALFCLGSSTITGWCCPVHCPKSNPNFRDITRTVEENEILHEIFHVSPLHFIRKIDYLGGGEVT